jgi:hypothetical protein
MNTADIQNVIKMTYYKANHKIKKETNDHRTQQLYKQLYKISIQLHVLALRVRNL